MSNQNGQNGQNAPAGQMNPTNTMLSTNLSPQNSMTDFLIYQMVMGKTQEITTTGIITMLLLTNIGEIKRIGTTIFTWIQDQLFKHIKECLWYCWNFLYNLFWFNWLRSKNQPDMQTNLLELQRLQKLQNDTPPLQNQINMSLKVVKNEVKSQVDLLALVHYMMNTGNYAKHIDNINRLSSDKFSAIEEHVLLHPIQIVDTNSDIIIEINEQIKSTVEIALHNSENIKLQQVQLGDRSEIVGKTEEIQFKSWGELVNSKFFPTMMKNYPELASVWSIIPRINTALWIPNELDNSSLFITKPDGGWDTLQQFLP